jgi:hypothetical protein
MYCAVEMDSSGKIYISIFHDDRFRHLRKHYGYYHNNLRRRKVCTTDRRDLWFMALI